MGVRDVYCICQYGWMFIFSKMSISVHVLSFSYQDG